MIPLRYLNSDYVDSLYGSYNFNFEDNYDKALSLLSRRGNVFFLSFAELDILKQEIHDYCNYYKKPGFNNEMLEKCEKLLIEIVEDVEFDRY